ncbi:hypothetical protein AX14_005948 [Amanita brunnescens Koide BX004]|nr:hypothetical protein AX14_005948 [Amanita brunnescens Koide BX004]
MALFSFVQLNNAHSGTWLHIGHKIGWVTCNNVSNNNTMFIKFAKHITASNGKILDPEAHCIWCLAHIINLATQALITTYSKLKHYNHTEPKVDLAAGVEQDGAGNLCEEEKDLAKQQKIDDLQLSDCEWEQIGLFNDLLAHADNVQQAFLADQETTLHCALPALKALHKAWTNEQAFSSTRITITKRHNQLKPDIMEVLQFLKCLYHHDLLFCEEAGTQFEMEESDQPRAMAENIGDLEGWDRIVEDLDDDVGFMDHNGEEIFIQEVV